MNITKVENRKRVICEESYLKWWQFRREGLPTLIEAVEKVNTECNSFYEIKTQRKNGYTEHIFKLYDVEIEICVFDSDFNIRTQMERNKNFHTWTHKLEFEDLFIPYLNKYLENYRYIWTTVESCQRDLS